MVACQIDFFWQLCRNKRSATPPIIFREPVERPWVHWLCKQVIGAMHRLSSMPQDSIHADILKVNIADAQEHSACGNWAGGIVKQFCCFGMASLVSSSGMTGLNFLDLQANKEGQLCNVRNGLLVSLRTAPSKRANPCTYFTWFLHPCQVRTHNSNIQCLFPGYSC